MTNKKHKTKQIKQIFDAYNSEKGDMSIVVTNSENNTKLEVNKNSSAFNILLKACMLDTTTLRCNLNVPLNDLTHMVDIQTDIDTNSSVKRSKLYHRTEIGKSAHNKPIYAWSNAWPLPKTIDMMIIGAIHGDEVMAGTFSQYLVDNKSFADSNKNIVIVPFPNPDGTANNKRCNGNNVDLNRDFKLDQKVHQSETRTLMKLIGRFDNIKCIISYHSGEVGICYPPDQTLAEQIQTVELKQKSKLSESLGRGYLDVSQFHKNKSAGTSPFKGGIIQSNQWYPSKGTLTDWAMLQHVDSGLTIELTDPKKLVDNHSQLYQEHIKGIQYLLTKI